MTVQQVGQGRIATGANLVSQGFKIHARLTPGSDRYLCRSGERFGDPVSHGATDRPVDCKRCLKLMEANGLNDEVRPYEVGR